MARARSLSLSVDLAVDLVGGLFSSLVSLDNELDITSHKNLHFVHKLASFVDSHDPFLLRNQAPPISLSCLVNYLVR